MKMHYQRSKTTKKLVQLTLPLLPVLLAVLLVTLEVPMPRPLTTAGHALALPFWHARDAVLATVVATYDSLSSKENLLRENEALYSELSALRRESFMARVLERENQELRTVLGRSDDTHTLLPASVINNSTYSPYDSFVIDVGTAEGVADTMLVLTPEGIAVGTVRATYTHTAIVTRFSAPTVTTEVIVEGTSTIHTTMTGFGSGTMYVSIPRDISVHVDDPVILPNFTGNPVGYVSVIDTAPEDAYQTIYVKHPVNQYELRYVLVDTAHTLRTDEQAVRDQLLLTASSTNEL